MTDPALILPDALVERIAQRAAELVIDRLERERPLAADADAWLDSKAAAAYLGLSRDGLHRLTAARLIPFSQAARGSRLFFKRSDLDQWREDQR